MWASLSNCPPPHGQEDGTTAYELETVFQSKRQIESDPVSHIMFRKCLSRRPNFDVVNLMDPAGSKLVRSKSVTSAKSAFLVASNNKVEKVHLAFSSWYDRNWVSSLDELAQNAENNDCPCLMKLIGKVAGSFLSTWRAFNLIGAFSTKSKVSDEDLVQVYSDTHCWSGSIVRCMAWHPQTSKLAIALRDDSIHVMGNDLQVYPLLKHKQERGVSSMAWRPFMSSELAVAAVTGIFIWTVDPQSVVARPSANCVCILPIPASHTPVNGLEYHPEGKFLMSHSARDSSVIIWNTSSERKVPLYIFNQGVQLTSWSPRGGAAIACSTSNVFKIINTNTWSQERWSVVAGRVNTACWSECGSTLLFTTNMETQIFCLKFDVSESDFVTAGTAVPVMDLAKVSYNLENCEEICVGGLVQAMKWDPKSCRLVLSFKESSLLAVFSTRVDFSSVSISPIGYIRGEQEEVPSCFEFASEAKDCGALLTVAWSSGRLQHVPMIFSTDGNPCVPTRDNSYLLNTSTEFNPIVFSSPAGEYLNLNKR